MGQEDNCQQVEKSEMQGEVNGDGHKAVSDPIFNDEEGKDPVDGFEVQNKETKQQLDLPLKPLPQNNEVEEFLEVANDREDMKIGNKEDFKKIFEEINERQAKMHEVNKAQKVKNVKKKQREKQINSDSIKDAEARKREAILQKLEPLVKKYRLLHSPTHSDAEVAKQRFEAKEKIFKYVLYYLEEIRTIKKIQELSEHELKLRLLQGNSAVQFAKSIANEIDVQFLVSLNCGNKLLASKKYKAQLKHLTSNIQDETNYQLRKKICTKVWNAKKLVTAEEIEFYPAEKREIIIERNKRILNEATIEEKPIEPESEELNVISFQAKQKWSQRSQEEEKKKGYKYVDEGTLSIIKMMLSDSQIDRMRKLLEEELKGPTKQRLLESMDTVFELKT